AYASRWANSVACERAVVLLNGSRRYPRGAHWHCLYTACARQLVCSLLQRSRIASTSQHPLMPTVEKPRSRAVSDPVPCTCSDENIKKAHAIREALRRKLLDE